MGKSDSNIELKCAAKPSPPEGTRALHISDSLPSELLHRPVSQAKPADLIACSACEDLPRQRLIPSVEKLFVGLTGVRECKCPRTSYGTAHGDRSDGPGVTQGSSRFDLRPGNASPRAITLQWIRGGLGIRAGPNDTRRLKQVLAGAGSVWGLPRGLCEHA